MPIHDMPARMAGTAVVVMAALLTGCAPAEPGSSSNAAAPPSFSSAAAPPSPEAPAPRTMPTVVPVQPAGARPAEPLPPPVSLSIDGTDISLDVVQVGIGKNNAMEIPDSFYQAGWYEYGPEPGADEGSAVIAGHVDSRTEVMPLAELQAVQPGTVVTVGRQGAEPLQYRVTEVQNIPKATLEGSAIFTRDGPHQLRIITCGGEWLPEKGDYEDNVVLTAVPL